MSYGGGSTPGALPVHRGGRGHAQGQVLPASFQEVGRWGSQGGASTFQPGARRFDVRRSGGQ
eukprot:238424-Lingulodinium_polyedra.AAC.1